MRLALPMTGPAGGSKHTKLKIAFSVARALVERAAIRSLKSRRRRIVPMPTTGEVKAVPQIAIVPKRPVMSMRADMVILLRT